MAPPEYHIVDQLGLAPGDIVVSEIPFHDAKHEDFIHFNNLEPGHICVWVNADKGFVRSHHESYDPPGLTFTGLWPGRHAVFRYMGDKEVVEEFANIMRNWASENLIVINSVPKAKAQSYLIAASDLFALHKNQNLIKLGSEGLCRAIHFASKREKKGEPEHRRGQRCTAIVTAAFQASILASIVKHYDDLHEFKQVDEVLAYADAVLHEGWRDSSLGKKLLEARMTDDYSCLFPEAFALDQRYATPKLLYHRLKNSTDFKFIGHYSYFNEAVIAIEKPEIKNT